MADGLEACGVDTVAIESISIYWVPVYEILAAREFSVNTLAEKAVAERDTMIQMSPSISMSAHTSHHLDVSCPIRAAS